MCKYYFFIFIIFFFLTLIGQRISDLFEAEAESARRNDVYGLRGLAEGPLLFFAHKSPGKSIFFVFFKISSSADWLLAKALAALANPAFFFLNVWTEDLKTLIFLKKNFLDLIEKSAPSTNSHGHLSLGVIFNGWGFWHHSLAKSVLQLLFWSLSGIS